MMGEMPKLKAKYPNMAHKDVVRKIGEMYKKLTPSKVDRVGSSGRPNNQYVQFFGVEWDAIREFLGVHMTEKWELKYYKINYHK